VTVLQSFYHDYNSAKEDYEDRWMKWMHFSLNNTSHDPGDGKYALQLVLRCSPVKITVYVTAPIVLSLVIGIWYMRHTGDIQIAWTISSYVMTAAGGWYFFLECNPHVTKLTPTSSDRSARSYDFAWRCISS
jgi:hypothetical protein